MDGFSVRNRYAIPEQTELPKQSRSDRLMQAGLSALPLLGTAAGGLIGATAGPAGIAGGGMIGGGLGMAGQALGGELLGVNRRQQEMEEEYMRKREAEMRQLAARQSAMDALSRLA